MSMHTYPLNDDDFEEVTIAKVRAEEGKHGGWSIECCDGWSFFVPKDSPVAPEVGMLARFYPKGIGYAVRGLFLNGQEVFYRTKAAHHQHEREQRYGKDAADLVRKWDEGGTIWSITLGGFGPGYEQAINVAAVEFAREGLDVPLEGDRETFFREGWDEVCNHAMERIKPWFTGLSGAQYGAAKWLAWQWVHGDGPTFVDSPKYSDRTIQVSRHWVPSGPKDGVGGTPAPVPVFRMELAAGDRYELRQLPDFGSLPEGEYVLHATPAAEDGVGEVGRG